MCKNTIRVRHDYSSKYYYTGIIDIIIFLFAVGVVYTRVRLYKQ